MDYILWPVDQGAPVDNLGYPIMKGDQMCWTVYNDADPYSHTNDAGETEPLGVEVKHTTWSYNTETSPNESTTIYIEYIITNKGNNTLKDLYLSFWVDADLGSAGNDLVGCDTLDDLFFTYNGDNYDTYYSGGNPPAIGFKVIHGPVVFTTIFP